MAFVGSGSSDGFYSTAVPFTGFNGTVFCRVFTGHHGGGARTMVSLGQAASLERVEITHNDSLGEMAITPYNTAGTPSGSVTNAGAAFGCWTTVVALMLSNTDRRIYYKGTPGKGTGSARVGNTGTSMVPAAAWDQFSIGYSKYNGTTGNGLNTRLRLANVVMWDRVLAVSDAFALVDGHTHPLNLRGPEPAYWFPLDGTGICEITGLSLTAEGTPRFDQAHDPLKPRPRLWVVPRQLSALSAPTISSTSDTNTLVDESSFVITGTNLTSATAVTFKQTGRPNYDATAFITANDATTVTLTGLDVQDMSMAYGAATVSVTTAGGTSADFAITIAPQAAHTHITLASTDAGVEWLGLTSADGDQRVSATTTTKGGTFAFVGTDGNYTITYAGTAPTNDSVYWAEFDDSADQWYESTVAINPAAGGSSASILNLMQHRDRKHLRQR